MTKQQLKQLSKYKQDYEAVRERLETLPDEVSHEVMVPLGKLAYVPGRLKHTNEIMVLLGENWFVERSAKQSVEIVRRRIAKCEETMNRLNSEIELHHSWEKSTKKLHSDLVNATGIDFAEEEEDEEAWREKHRQKVRDYRQKLAGMREKGIPPEGGDDDTLDEEVDIWKRLDELELQEELEHELDLLGSEEEDTEEDEEDQEYEEYEEKEEERGGCDEVNEETELINNHDDSPMENDDSAKSRKGVTWSETDSVRQFRIDEILSKTEAMDEGTDTLKIHFKHTPTKKSSSAQSAAAVAAAEAEEVISSPSDIFRKFCRTPETEAAEPKSILKVKKSTTPVIETPQDDPPPQRQQKKQVTAVGDEVKEHVLMEPKQEVASAEVNTHRPVSRFKASRLNRKL